jgi:hypothetical protein
MTNFTAKYDDSTRTLNVTCPDGGSCTIKVANEERATRFVQRLNSGTPQERANFFGTRVGPTFNTGRGSR